MSEMVNEIAAASERTWSKGVELIEKLFTVARPGAVFSEPLETETHTVITASEVLVGVGFGYGTGGGTGIEAAVGQGEGGAGGEEAGESDNEGEGDSEGEGFGSGGGGGGGSIGRPVAVISVGADGVKVQPVVDVTKIGIALLTTVGSMLVMLGRIRKASR